MREHWLDKWERQREEQEEEREAARASSSSGKEAVLTYFDPDNNVDRFAGKWSARLLEHAKAEARRQSSLHPDKGWRLRWMSEKQTDAIIHQSMLLSDA